MRQQTFDGLCDQIRGAPLTGHHHDRFGVPDADELSFFIPPVLVGKDLDAAERSPVTLLSARGAAGKSTSAVELARRLAAPLWRLERDKAVSGTSLEFALGQYLRCHDVGERLRELGGGLVVVDSLDEARTRVSGVSWNEFLASVVAAIPDGLRVVLLGRERTLEDVWVTLAEAGVPVAWWELSHFAPEQCVSYVDAHVHAREPGTDLTSPLYRAARDAVLDSLRTASDGEFADEFVGYAPVLDAVAAMLMDRPNMQVIVQRFGRGNGGDRVGLLRDILERLLDRDQTKIAQAVEELGLDRQTTYTPGEQQRWLCHHLEGAPLPSLDHITDPQQRQHYVDRVAGFAQEHPFRSDARWASPIFEAYVAAALFDDDAFAPGRLIEIGDTSEFLLDFIDRSDDLVVSEVQFAALHASGLASGRTRSMTALDQVDDTDFFTGTLVVHGAETDTPQITRFTVLPDESGVLQLLAPLTDLSVSSHGTVVVPGDTQGTVVGPDLFLRAEAIRFEGHTLDFARRTRDADDSAVVLVASRALQLPPSASQVPHLDGLELRVPDSIRLAHPWFDYRSTLQADIPLDDKLVRFLNKLMNLTRNHGHSGERGVYSKKLEGRQPFDTNDFHTVLDALVTEGVVRRDNEIVFLRAEWEQYRYSGKGIAGQRTFDDVRERWAPVLSRVGKALRG